MASADSQPSAPVTALLQRPEIYPDRPERVEVIETHLSWVFLTDRFASKLKKPVRFEFVDFSTPAARRCACEEELRLNQRLAASVYLQVLPITETAGGELSLGGSGSPIDWVVQMRRLSAERTLEAAIRSGRVRESDVCALGEVLVEFYRQTAPLCVAPHEFRAQIERHVRNNFRELQSGQHQLDVMALRRTSAAQLRLLKLAPQLFDARAREGRVIEGHGDLRPEHVYLESPPVVIDCLEFSRDLRTLDVADELCFLAMECERLGNPSVGERILDHYRRQSGDRPPPELLAFYKAYRAGVRVLVATLRAAQLLGAAQQKARQAAHDLAGEYVALAERYVVSLGPPPLIVVGGRSGTGKTTLAARLAAELGAEHWQTDVLRQELFGRSAPDAEGAGGGKGGDRYRPENRDLVYDEMLRRARHWIEQGVPVVLDGTFLAARWCSGAIEVADRAKAVSLIVRCHCPDSVAHVRIAARLAVGDSASEARPELPIQQQREQEPLPAGAEAVEIDTTMSLDAQVDAVFDRLRPLVYPGL